MGLVVGSCRCQRIGRKRLRQLGKAIVVCRTDSVGNMTRFFAPSVCEEAAPAESMDDFRGWVNDLSGKWGFRGQRESRWTLQTSLDREVTVAHDTGHYPLHRRGEEDDLLFRFQQQVQHYVAHLPSVEDRAGWLALMQHYGVPTRLLDWTQSPYVALYFAVEAAPAVGGARSRAGQEEFSSAVWVCWRQSSAIAEPMSS